MDVYCRSDLCRHYDSVAPLLADEGVIDAFHEGDAARGGNCLGSEQEMISLETSECEIVCDWIDEQSQGRDSCNHQFVVKR